MLRTLKSALPLGALVALSLAPAALAVPPEPCSTCEQPPPVDRSVNPTISLGGPADAMRLTAQTFTAATTGGKDHSGAAAEVTKIQYDLDGDGAWDNDAGTDASRSITYPKGFKTGALTVKAKVTSAGGTATASRTVTIGNAQPAGSFTISDPTPPVGVDVTFAGTATDADSANAGVFNWNQGGGTWCDIMSGRTCPGATWSRSFDTPGEYTIGLEVRDTDGGLKRVTQTVTTHAAPVAAITATPSPVAGKPVTLDASGSTGEGELHYVWDLNGGSDGFETDGGTSPVRQHVFAAGRHAVSVQVVDSDGMVSSTALDLVVAPAPKTEEPKTGTKTPAGGTIAPAAQVTPAPVAGTPAPAAARSTTVVAASKKKAAKQPACRTIKTKKRGKTVKKKVCGKKATAKKKTAKKAKR